MNYVSAPSESYDATSEDHIPVMEYPEYDSDFDTESYITSHYENDYNDIVPGGHHEDMDQFNLWYRHEQATMKKRERQATQAAHHAKEMAQMAEARAVHAEYKAKLADERAQQL